MKILILGATGMLGSAVFKVFSKDAQYDVWGTMRANSERVFFTEAQNEKLIDRIDVLNQDDFVALLNHIRPEVVINGVGLIKQLAGIDNPLVALPINSLFPHKLAELCNLLGARLIQLSSDCVYSGRQGNYKESSPSDTEDLYGKSKYLGELHNAPHVITLRTSGIGHELNSNNGLLAWFLSQQGSVKGYTKAIYSGLPSVELARVIKDFVLPHPELNGLYHVSAQPISKFDLISLVAKVYGKKIEIMPCDQVIIDRSLNSERFMKATNYVAADWLELVTLMYNSR